MSLSASASADLSVRSEYHIILCVLLCVGGGGGGGGGGVGGGPAQYNACGFLFGPWTMTIM